MSGETMEEIKRGGRTKSKMFTAAIFPRKRDNENAR